VAAIDARLSRRNKNSPRSMAGEVCMFGSNCRRPGCWYEHPGGAGTPDWDMFPDGFGPVSQPPPPPAAIRACKTPCPDCRKKFGSEAAMAEHWRAKHGPAAVDKRLSPAEKAKRRAKAEEQRVRHEAANAQQRAHQAAVKKEAEDLRRYGWPGVSERLTADEYLDRNLAEIRCNRPPRGALNSPCTFCFPNTEQVMFHGLTIDMDRAVSRISDALRVNTTLRTLVLEAADGIGEAGVRELARSLDEGENTTLQKLNMRYTNFGAQSSTAIANMLKKNTTLTCLQLDKGKSGPVLAQEIARALSHNTSLTSLNLVYNKIGDEGATHLAAALAHNTTLKHLHFYENGILDEGTVALGLALKNSPSLAASGISIKLHKGVDHWEKGLGYYWQQLGLPPVARSTNWPNDKVVSFFRHVQQEERDRRDRRLALAMGLHPRLGREAGMRLLDDCLIAYVLQQVEADSSSPEWREDRDFFARFYGAYDTAVLKQEFEPGPGHMVLRHYWTEVTVLEAEAVAFADKCENSCALSAAPDLFEKLAVAFRELGAEDMHEEMLERADAASAKFQADDVDPYNPYDSDSQSLGYEWTHGIGPYGGYSPSDGYTHGHGGMVDPDSDVGISHDFRDGVCAVCFLQRRR